MAGLSLATKHKARRAGAQCQWRGGRRVKDSTILSNPNSNGLTRRAQFVTQIAGMLIQPIALLASAPCHGVESGGVPPSSRHSTLLVKGNFKLGNKVNDSSQSVTATPLFATATAGCSLQRPRPRPQSHSPFTPPVCTRLFHLLFLHSPHLRANENFLRDFVLSPPQQPPLQPVSITFKSTQRACPPFTSFNLTPRPVSSSHFLG